MPAGLGFSVPLLTAAVYLYLTERIPYSMFGDPLGPRAFPRVIMGVMVVSSVLWLLERLSAGRAAVPFPEVRQDEGAASTTPLLTVAVVAWSLLYVSVIEYLGFLIATMVFLVVLINVFNRPRWKTSTAAAILFPLFAYFAFTRLLLIPLPKGVLLPI